MVRILALLAVLTFAMPAAAQCCGDCDGNGTVDITELVTAVLGSLGTCGDRLQCPYTFADDTIHTPSLCLFTGRFNVSDCPGRQLDALFAGDGSVLVVGFMLAGGADLIVGFGADVTGPLRAELADWSDDLFDTDHPARGAIMLSADHGTLTVAPTTAPFTIGGCAFERFVGQYGGEVGMEAKASRPSPAAVQRLLALYQYIALHQRIRSELPEITP